MQVSSLGDFLAIAVTIWRLAAQRSFYRPIIKVMLRDVFEPLVVTTRRS
jgi:hypothetical protein